MGDLDAFLTEDLYDITEQVRTLVKEQLEDSDGTDFTGEFEFEDEETIDAEISIVYPATGRKTEVVKRFKVNVTVTVVEE